MVRQNATLNSQPTIMKPPTRRSREVDVANPPASSSRWSRIVTRSELTIVGGVLAVKALIFIYGALAWQIIENKVSPGWLTIWNRWDAAHYQTLAVHGYQSAGDERFLLVYFPLYPWLIRIVTWIDGRPYVGAFLISTFASIAAALLLDKLATLDEEKTQHWPVWFLLIFPTSYFLHIGYTESLFLALTLGAFVAARRRQWPVAGAVGFLAALTRLNGLLLLPVLALDAWNDYRQTRRWRWNWLWLLQIPIAPLLYLLLNYRLTGSPWTFLTFQKVHWFRSLTWPWIGINESIKTYLSRTPEDAQIIGGQELFFAFLGLVCIFWCWRKLRPSYTLWMAGNWLLITSTPFLLSVPRYTLTMFPIYFLFARAARMFVWRLVLTTWSVLFLALFAVTFVRGHWAF
jgi:hypothetical protein